MTVKDLINVLGTLPLETEIVVCHDDGLFAEVGMVYHPRWGAHGQLEIGWEGVTAEIRGTRLWPVRAVGRF